MEAYGASTPVRKQAPAYEHMDSSSSCPSTVDSTFDMSRYGEDVGMDTKVGFILEERLGYDPEYADVRAAIKACYGKWGTAPSLRQLAVELGGSPVARSLTGAHSHIPGGAPAVSGYSLQTVERRVPCLDLFGVAKGTFALKGAPSPGVDDSGGESPVAAAGAGAAGKIACTPESNSPTNIFKKLMPTVGKLQQCDKRAVLRTPTTERDTPIVVHHVSRACLDDHLALAPGMELPLNHQRQLGRLRMSVDCLGQQQTGPLQGMATQVPGVRQPAGAVPSLALGRSNSVFEASGSPVRRLAYPGVNDGSSNNDEASQIFDSDVRHQAAKRQLHLLSCDVQAACTTTKSSNTVTGLQADSDLRQDTPCKDATAHADAHRQSSMSAKPGVRPGLNALSAHLAKDDHAEPDVLRGSHRQRLGVVPSLTLPTQLPGVRNAGLQFLGAHCDTRGAANVTGAPPVLGCIPSLSLSSSDHQQARAVGSQAALPTGMRTRRRSVCLPSAMVYGDGPLTTRRMAAGAALGVTSHALGPVFWADSEEDSEDVTSSYDSGEDALEEDGIHHAVDDAAASGADTGLAGSPSFSRMAVTDAAAIGRDGNGRARRRRRAAQACGGGDQDDTDKELMLPEDLWNVWEQLGNPPKGHQYRLLESLAHVKRISCTTYSTVYKAYYQDRPVVVKTYDVAERDKLGNAIAEVGTLMQLKGWPGSVQLLEYGRNDDQVMLVLESCDQNLKDWCDAQRYKADSGPDYILECLRHWRTLAELLTELHERHHVAHCDIKPGNVLLSGERLLLADFSESMWFRETPLLRNEARGTVPYQPPEMIGSHCVDARKADVWAMGCILFEMVTGELLFKGGSDAMRAVSSGLSAAAQQLQQLGDYARNRLASGNGSDSTRGGRSGRPAGVWKASQEQPQQQDLSQTSSLPVATRFGASCGGEQLQAGPTAPRVPRLPLGLARPPQASPLRSQPHSAHPPSSGPQQPLALPAHLLSSRSGLAAMTGRSLELIAEGSVAEDAASLHSDPWVMGSALNTGRTTARSMLAFDTARSMASGSTTAATWPPPPPPSVGTARSVAESEWMLSAAVLTARNAGLEAAASFRAPQPEMLPPHRRLRRSVATQCADPAGPDWLTTEEADRLRIMADEPPSFVKVEYAPSGSSSPGSGLGIAGASASASKATGTTAGSGGDVDYTPRLLSGADGPSLCDEVMRLLRAVLVEDYVRPSMHQLATLATDILDRRSALAQSPLLSESDFTDLRSAPHAIKDQGGPDLVSLAPGVPKCASSCGESAQAAGSLVLLRALPPPLSLASLQSVLSAVVPSSGGVSAGGSDTRASLGRGGFSTGGGSWGDGSSLGGAELPSGDFTDPSDGGATTGGVLPASAAQPASLFDACQPLVTSRDSRGWSQSWQPFLRRR